MKVDKIKTFGEDALEWWWYLNVSEVNNEILICVSSDGLSTVFFYLVFLLFEQRILLICIRFGT